MSSQGPTALGSKRSVRRLCFGPTLGDETAALQRSPRVTPLGAGSLVEVDLGGDEREEKGRGGMGGSLFTGGHTLSPARAQNAVMSNHSPTRMCSAVSAQPRTSGSHKG